MEERKARENEWKKYKRKGRDALFMRRVGGGICSDMRSKVLAGWLRSIKAAETNFHSIHNGWIIFLKDDV